MIRQIKLKDFRNYDELHLEINSSQNLFIGNNGQGKSNLLEAIFFTAMLRSFRTVRTVDIKKIGSKGFYIGVEAFTGGRWPKLFEIEYFNTRKLQIDGNPVHKGSEFIRDIRTVAFLPDDIDIVTGNSGLRRRFVDMFLAVTDPMYMSYLHQYVSALKVRNAVLKDRNGDLNVVAAYEPVMAEAASYIVARRKEYAVQLSAEVTLLLNGFHDPGSLFAIRYRTDTDGDVTLWQKKLEKERGKDKMRGFTGFGPQLDEFEFYFNEKLLRNFGSTGQCRLISLCLKMANVNILAADSNIRKENIIVLIDDVTGELDEKTRNSFFQVINLAGQSFFTFTARPSDDYFKNSDVFIVNDGKVTA